MTRNPHISVELRDECTALWEDDKVENRAFEIWERKGEDSSWDRSCGESRLRTVCEN